MEEFRDVLLSWAFAGLLVAVPTILVTVAGFRRRTPLLIFGLLFLLWMWWSGGVIVAESFHDGPCESWAYCSISSLLVGMALLVIPIMASAHLTVRWIRARDRRGDKRRLDARVKAILEKHVFSKPFARRANLWLYGPIPAEERPHHLAVVIGEARLQRLIVISQIAGLVLWICGPVYELSEGDIRRGASVVAAIAALIILRTLWIMRRALHQPSRAHEYRATHRDEGPRDGSAAETSAFDH